MRCTGLWIRSLHGTAVSLLMCAAPAWAAQVAYGFDTFADGAAITTQISGLTFVNATAIKAGVSLNELEFPPRSGDTVLFDDGAPIIINFAAPVFRVGGYFNYSAGLNFSAYDSLNQLLGFDASDFATNLALSGDAGSSPNEFLGFNSTSGRISRVVITGDVSGGSFTLDDLTVDAGTVNNVPEPATLALVLGMLGAGCVPRGWLRSRPAS